MPVFSRKQLRRDLSLQFIRDSSFRNTPATSYSSSAVTGGSVSNIGAPLFIDTEASGFGLYKGSWLFVESSVGAPDTASTWFQYTIASFNVLLGWFTTGQVAVDAHFTPLFEIHTRVSPLDKHGAIDDTIKRIRVRQEVAMPTFDGAMIYTIDNAASPFVIDRVLDIHIASNPDNSQVLDLRHIPDWVIVSTATGNQLRLKYAVQGSQQLRLDCILIPSLGGELATINIPDERWVLAGAAMRCYDFMIQSAPAQQVAQLQQRRAEWAAEYARLSSKFQPMYDEPVKFHDVIRGAVGKPWDAPNPF